jgi:hypothetical protein
LEVCLEGSTPRVGHYDQDAWCTAKPNLHEAEPVIIIIIHWKNILLTR